VSLVDVCDAFGIGFFAPKETLARGPSMQPELGSAGWNEARRALPTLDHDPNLSGRLPIFMENEARQKDPEWISLDPPTMQI
jgi:hypothetical protein